MTPADIDRVFGRGRLRMVTGDHVEVFREAALPGERRRYTKRFLATEAGDFRHWTEREWRILARLVGHGIGPVPDVVQFDRGAADRPALVQTYDAGVTVDHWATLLPVERDGAVLRHVFEDCAHWWALAQHCLIALDAIHELQLVHLDLKADNVCIPLGPPDFDPYAAGGLLAPDFAQIALIDFAFSLVSGEVLASALPIARQADYDYQSPRLLHALEAGRHGDLAPTRQLDWRCDVFSLAAMLRRYLPDPESTLAAGWTPPRHAQARALVRRLLQAHDEGRPTQRPHVELIALAAQALDDAELAASLARGWTLATRCEVAGDDSPTPVTRIALPLIIGDERDLREIATPLHAGQSRARRTVWIAGLVAAAGIGLALAGDAWLVQRDRGSQVAAADELPPRVASPPEAPPSAAPAAAAQDGKTADGAEPATTGESPVAPLVAASAAASEAAATAQVPAPVSERAAATAKPARRYAPRTTVQTAAAPRAPVPAAAAPRPVEPKVAAAATLSARDRALAALTLRGPAPRSAQVPAAPAPPAMPVAPQPPAPAPPPVPAATQALPVVVAAAPVPQPVEVPAAPAIVDLGLRASELIATQTPRIVQRAERQVQRVLNLASRPDTGAQDDEIRGAASAIRIAPDDPLLKLAVAAEDARRLDDAARVAYWRRGNVQEALGLQTRAFGANPLDPRIVGNLALLHLMQSPPQAEAARQFALQALITHDATNPNGRIDDWTTLAIASALTGRARDARDAWWVSLVLAPDAQRQCRAAASAFGTYGEALRAPVEAMLYRANVSGRTDRSRFCEWPPRWMAGSQMR